MSVAMFLSCSGVHVAGGRSSFWSLSNWHIILSLSKETSSSQLFPIVLQYSSKQKLLHVGLRDRTASETRRVVHQTCVIG